MHVLPTCNACGEASPQLNDNGTTKCCGARMTLPLLWRCSKCEAEIVAVSGMHVTSCCGAPPLRCKLCCTARSPRWGPGPADERSLCAACSADYVNRTGAFGSLEPFASIVPDKQTFLSIMKSYRACDIDAGVAVQQVAQLCTSKPSILETFNKLLPQRWRVVFRDGKVLVQCPASADAFPSVKKTIVTSIKNSSVPAGENVAIRNRRPKSFSNPTVVDSSAHETRQRNSVPVPLLPRPPTSNPHFVNAVPIQDSAMVHTTPVTHADPDFLKGSSLSRIVHPRNIVSLKPPALNSSPTKRKRPATSKRRFSQPKSVPSPNALTDVATLSHITNGDIIPLAPPPLLDESILVRASRRKSTRTRKDSNATTDNGSESRASHIIDLTVTVSASAKGKSDAPSWKPRDRTLRELARYDKELVRKRTLVKSDRKSSKRSAMAKRELANAEQRKVTSNGKSQRQPRRQESNLSSRVKESSQVRKSDNPDQPEDKTGNRVQKPSQQDDKTNKRVNKPSQQEDKSSNHVNKPIEQDDKTSNRLTKPNQQQDKTNNRVNKPNEDRKSLNTDGKSHKTRKQERRASTNVVDTKSKTSNHLTKPNQQQEKTKNRVNKSNEDRKSLNTDGKTHKTRKQERRTSTNVVDTKSKTSNRLTKPNLQQEKTKNRVNKSNEDRKTLNTDGKTHKTRKQERRTSTNVVGTKRKSKKRASDDVNVIDVRVPKRMRTVRNSTSVKSSAATKSSVSASTPHVQSKVPSATEPPTFMPWSSLTSDARKNRAVDGAKSKLSKDEVRGLRRKEDRSRKRTSKDVTPGTKRSTGETMNVSKNETGIRKGKTRSGSRVRESDTTIIDLTKSNVVLPISSTNAKRTSNMVRRSRRSNSMGANGVGKKRGQSGEVYNTLSTSEKVICSRSKKHRNVTGGKDEAAATSTAVKEDVRKVRQDGKGNSNVKSGTTKSVLPIESSRRRRSAPLPRIPSISSTRKPWNPSIIPCSDCGTPAEQGPWRENGALCFECAEKASCVPEAPKEIGNAENDSQCDGCEKERPLLGDDGLSTCCGEETVGVSKKNESSPSLPQVCLRCRTRTANGSGVVCNGCEKKSEVEKGSEMEEKKVKYSLETPASDPRSPIPSENEQEADASIPVSPPPQFEREDGPIVDNVAVPLSSPQLKGKEDDGPVVDIVPVSVPMTQVVELPMDIAAFASIDFMALPITK